MGSSKDWTRERVDPASFYWQLLMGFTRVLIGSLRPGGWGELIVMGYTGMLRPKRVQFKAGGIDMWSILTPSTKRTEYRILLFC